MLLVHVSELDGLADGDGAGVRLLDAHYQAEEGGLARSVGTDDTDYAGRGQGECQVLEQELVAVGLGNVVEFDYLVAQTGTVGDVYFQSSLLGLAVLAGQLLVCAETGLGLGLAGLRSHAHPLQLALKGLAALALLLLLHLQPLALLLQP